MDCFFIVFKRFIKIKRLLLKLSFRPIAFPWSTYKMCFKSKFNYLLKTSLTFYFQVFIDREQPFYLLLNNHLRLKSFFSTGFLLKLHGMGQKYLRRSTERHFPIILFFYKFLYKKCIKANSAFVLFGYRRKYLHFINLLLSNLITFCFKSIFILPQLKMNLYFFRKFKAIKKRIKKKLLTRQRKYLY